MAGSGLLIRHCITHSRPGESKLIIDLVDFLAPGVAKFYFLSVIIELVFEWPKD